VTGRTRPIVEHGRQEAEPRVIDPPPRAQHGRLAGGGSRPPVEDLRLYRRHEYLRYWYVPVAAALAVVVAVGVIWAADGLFGGGGNEPAAPAPTPTATASAAANVTTTGTPTTPTPGTQTPATATGSPPAGTPTPSSIAGTGQFRVVGGTGGDCLNIRTGPGTASPAADCLAEGTVVELTGESEESGGITWVRIVTESGHDGWVAEQYLLEQ